MVPSPDFDSNPHFTHLVSPLTSPVFLMYCFQANPRYHFTSVSVVGTFSKCKSDDLMPASKTTSSFSLILENFQISSHSSQNGCWPLCLHVLLFPLLQFLPQSHCPDHMPCLFLPQDLCTSCSLHLEYSSPRQLHSFCCRQHLRCLLISLPLDLHALCNSFPLSVGWTTHF